MSAHAHSTRTSRRAQRRAGSRRVVPDWALPWLTVLAAMGLWELVSRTGLIPSQHFPPITEVLPRLVELMGTSGFWTAVGQTAQGWALGLGIAAALGIPLGILIGSSPLAYKQLRFLIEFMRPIPAVALIPAAIIIFGVGMQSKVFLAAFAAFWPVLMQTLYGVQDTDPTATDTARSFGFGRLACLVRVTLPSALPYIATGLRIASAVALILAVTAELVIGAPGLGHDISVARQSGAVDSMYALIIATGILGYVLNLIFQRLERRLLHWHPSQRTVVQ